MENPETVVEVNISVEWFFIYFLNDLRVCRKSDVSLTISRNRRPYNRKACSLEKHLAIIILSKSSYSDYAQCIVSFVAYIIDITHMTTVVGAIRSFS